MFLRDLWALVHLDEDELSFAAPLQLLIITKQIWKIPAPGKRTTSTLVYAEQAHPICDLWIIDYKLYV